MKSRANAENVDKVTRSLSKSSERHISNEESDALVARINEIKGDESVSAFARRCGVGESLIRKYLAGSQPGIFTIVAIANAGSVTVDWLATGRLPKTRAEYRAQLQAPADPGAYDGRRDILEAALRVMEYKIKHNKVDANVIAAGLAGATSWLDAAQDYPDLEVRLRSALATLEFIKAAGPLPSQP